MVDLKSTLAKSLREVIVKRLFQYIEDYNADYVNTTLCIRFKRLSDMERVVEILEEARRNG